MREAKHLRKLWVCLKLAGPTTLVAFLYSTGAALATPLFYDNFAGDIRDLAQTNLVNWTVVQGNVDVVNPGEANGCPGSAPGKCVDLDGSFVTTLAKMQTKSEFLFQAGQEYELVLNIPSVNVGGPPNHDSFKVLVGSLFSETFSGYAVPLAITRQFTPGADELARIQIEMLDGRNFFGPFLTEVSLNTTAQAVVPEPSTAVLCGTGLAMFAIRRLRRSES